MKMKFLIKKIHDLYAIRCPKCNEELFWDASARKIDYLECKNCKVFYELNSNNKKKNLIISVGHKEFIEDAKKRFPSIIKETRIRTSDFYMPEKLQKICYWLNNKFNN